MLRFELNHYGTGSIITCLDDLKHVSAIVYTRKIHSYESKADFDTIKTELLTYGEKAAYEIYNYFWTARQPNKANRSPVIYKSGNIGVDPLGVAVPRRAIT